MTTGLDRTYHAHRFIFSFTFYFFVCSVWWTKLATRQLFTARYIHTIVSYRIKRVKNTIDLSKIRLDFIKTICVQRSNEIWA